MAIVEETIGSGKDRATVTLWESNVGVFGTDTYKGIIQESVNFDENVTLNGSTGTPSITSYLWLTSDPANRHAGIAGTGHARMAVTSSGHVLQAVANFTRIDWLEIEQDQTTESDEGIRVTGDDCLIEYNIIWTDRNGADQDAIHMPEQTDLDRVRISNNIIYGWERGGIYIQNFGATAMALTGDFQHNTIWDCETAAIYAEQDGAASVFTIRVDNNIGATTVDPTSPIADSADQEPTNGPDGTVTWNGAANAIAVAADLDDIDGTNNLTASELATDGVAVVTKSSGAWIVFTNITSGSVDLTLLDDAAGNLAAGNGVNLIGSEPDARQDFSVAIDGPRSAVTVDIGASQISAGGTVTETIGTGKDRTTVTLWEANVDPFGADIYKGLIQTNDNFNEEVQLVGSTGTPSITSYLWLTVDPANDHAGVAGTGHGRMVHASPASGRIIEVGASFTRVSKLEVELGGTGSSDECFRILEGADDVLIQYCIIHADTTTSNQDGIYVQSATDLGSTLRLRVDNCIMYRFGRKALYVQQNGDPEAYTFTGNMDHCSITDCTDATDGVAVFFEQNDDASVFTFTIFNTWATGNDDDSPISDGRVNDPTTTPDGTMTWNGSHNAVALPGDLLDIDGTNNLTNEQLCTDGIADVTKSSGAWIVVTETAQGTENLLLLDDAAGNLPAGNGVNRQGSEPDARQDFSIDITGGARPTTGVDIGAHQVSVAGGPDPTLPPRYRSQVYHQDSSFREDQVFA